MTSYCAIGNKSIVAQAILTIDIVPTLVNREPRILLGVFLASTNHIQPLQVIPKLLSGEARSGAGKLRVVMTSARQLVGDMASWVKVLTSNLWGIISNKNS